jgi:hypothetical protein
MDNEFLKNRAQQVRELADKADPFMKQRLITLASDCERQTERILTAQCLQRRSARKLERTDFANAKRPRQDRCNTTSWCRNPLPPLTKPRSRITQ